MKPTYALFATWDGLRANFTIIEDMGIPQAREFYDYHKMFNGSSAVVFVFFSDYDLRDSDLKEVATRFMKGEYIRHDVDLKNLTWKETKGLDKTTPTH